MSDLVIEETRIGINISNTSIEVMQINSMEEVVSFGRYRCFSKCDSFGWVDENMLADALIQTLSKHVPTYRKFFKQGLTNKNKLKAYLSVPESKTYIHHFDLKRESDESVFKNNIVLYIKKNLSINIDELSWDYLIVHDDVGNNNVRVVFIGVPLSLVRGLMNVVETAGLEVVSIENEALSLGRSLLENHLDKGVIIVDIGTCQTNLTLFYNDCIPFV